MPREGGEGNGTQSPTARNNEQPPKSSGEEKKEKKEERKQEPEKRIGSTIRGSSYTYTVTPMEGLISYYPYY